MARALPALVLGLVALLLLVATYALAFGTAGGLAADGQAIPTGLAGPDIDRVAAATSTLLGTISVGSLVLAGVGVATLGLLRRRPAQSLAALAIVVGANATTQLLKPLLARLDPLGGDVERLSQGSFPSGHATVAMSLALAIVVVTPAQARPAVALGAGLYSAAVGVGMLLLGWHFPSDVAAGFLIATAWAAAAVALLRARERPEAATIAPAPRVRTGIGAALGLAALVAIAAAAAIGARISDLGQVAEYGRLQAAFFASAAIITLLALALPASVTAVLLRTARGKTRPTGP